MANEPTIEARVTVLEQTLAIVKSTTDQHIGRIISDIESEKGSRSRQNDRWSNDFGRLDTRIASLERHVWIGIGIITAMQFIVPLILSLIRK